MPGIPWDILTQIGATVHNFMLVDLMKHDGFNEMAEGAMNWNVSFLLHYVENEQPVWWEDRGPEPIYGGIPSVRQGDTPISESWEPRSEVSEDGVTAELWNTSKHVQAVLTGQIVDVYTISARNAPFLYFWWGEPLPWEPKDGEDPGPRKRKSMDRGEVRHMVETAPGEPPESVFAYDSSREANPFMRRAMVFAMSADSMRRQTATEISNWIRREFEMRNFRYEGRERGF